MIDKTLILKKLKAYKNFETNASFARFLEITPQNLSKWYSRNTFDISILATKFPEVDIDWLLTGNGEMLKQEDEQKASKEDSNDEYIRIKHDDYASLIHTIASQAEAILKLTEKKDACDTAVADGAKNAKPA